MYNGPGPFSFAEKPPRRSRRTQPSTANESPHSLEAQDLNFLQNDQLNDQDAISDSPSLDMKQIELVLQWINHTHKLFARNEATRPIWEMIILQEALHAPLLMHGILAISALHLSHLREDGRHVQWLDVAIAHKNTALSMFSEQLSNISQQNAKVMMIFAGLAFAFSLASALNMNTSEDGPGLTTLTDVFVLARGIQTVVNAGMDFLRQSNLAPLFEIGTPDVTIPTHVTEAINDLDQLNTRYHLQNSPKKESYARAIKNLQELAVFSFAEPTSMTMAAGWAIRAPADFLDDLKEQKPFALVILGHYCVFLHMARENWCIGSWGRKVLAEIPQLLDPDWQPYIGWAVEQVLGTDTESTYRGTGTQKLDISV